MNPGERSVLTRTRQIPEDLVAVRENLLALSDDIWLPSIFPPTGCRCFFVRIAMPAGRP